MEKRKLTPVIVLVVLIALGIFSYQYWVGQPAEGELPDELNPFATQKTENPFEESGNPYENIKTNPFE